MRPPSATQSRAVAVAPAPRGFLVVACPESIARGTRCLLLTHTSIRRSTARPVRPAPWQHRLQQGYFPLGTSPRLSVGNGLAVPEIRRDGGNHDVGFDGEHVYADERHPGAGIDDDALVEHPVQNIDVACAATGALHGHHQYSSH